MMKERALRKLRYDFILTRKSMRYQRAATRGSAGGSCRAAAACCSAAALNASCRGEAKVLQAQQQQCRRLRFCAGALSGSCVSMRRATSRTAASCVFVGCELASLLRNFWEINAPNTTGRKAKQSPRKINALRW